MIIKLYRGLQLLLFIFLITASAFAQKNYPLKSPDSRIQVNLHIGKSISYTLHYDQQQILALSEIGLVLPGGRKISENVKVSSVRYDSTEENVISPLYRQSQFTTKWNEVNIRFDNHTGLIFRLYNEGIAYRLYNNQKKGFDLEKEIVEFNFYQDYQVFVPYSTGKKDRFAMAFQNTYDRVPASTALDSMVAFLPVAVDLKDGKKMVITESDLEDYPGMFLEPNANTKGFQGLFAGYPDEKIIDPYRYQEKVKSRLAIAAKIKPHQKLPWRVITLSDDDRQLPVNNMVYALAAPSRLKDISWVKPGKAAWEWWNNWGLTGVNFKSGINTETYKYYIDFASANKLEYIIMDEGWSPPAEGNVMKVIDQIDLPEIINYGKKKGVGVFIWAVANVLDAKLEEACSYYSKLGVKGLKIDFIDRDDQDAVNMIYRIAEMSARYKLMVDYHGIYKPTGLNRTYPNVVNFEGVFGMEEMKWSKKDMPLYDVTMPFIRMMAGAVDHTQGAMRNAIKSNFRDVFYAPMSQGTRCHQLAAYIVFDAPFVMLCDAPTAYMKEQESTDFIASLPVVFEETKVIEGKMGESIVTARKSGGNWFIGGLTNWSPRMVEIDLSFLDEGKEYAVDLFKDGMNADKLGEDYSREKFSASKGKKIKIELAPGGGFAMQLKIKN